MIRYRITHDTSYDYSEVVSLCQNVAHLSPRECVRQRADDSVMTISPDPAVIEDRTDYFGNPVSYFTVQEQHRELTVSVTHRVEVWSPPPPDPAATPAWELVRDRLRTDHTPAWLDAYQYAFDSRYVAADPRYAGYAAASFAAGRPIVAAALDLTERIFEEFVYDPRATTLATPVAEVFEKRRGVCQDFAHLMLAVLRSVGLAARYVSGYLATVPAPGKPRLVGADATHAWVSVFCGDLGWVDFDPTNNQIPGDRYVLLAWGRDYEDVSPLKGVILGGGQHVVRVSVDVRPEEEGLEDRTEWHA
ncbi:Transglutaminase domain protein OS=Planctomyces limnophilus (strain ATCC 43296 / DSM 3776 / IFAM 1008 / 290) GN=Plim_1494 PE=4 SV=1: Bact_transglu_N: Transglut_core [Gemmataceae bacterium]|nr:Transglutaminase domain protein OS=Planctomyces limnophilus (strain ATCC 43296 / DSM 3776 / IFAM 1008 / 290) GN=Plim_1494 PE=4 SV=1: Bact_transglu_N: Transglut_core [Gemmataceae bacterium]VTT97180.1 Transglutaminase domain protein OS=Planctomyces limnophilus (strain ATCC 43296 / DSM 3776 / IFAM 1008 / 290) GN=Plim_1494 PE=4 SV=1: Bact_transglu_N: Transglut_core [Gemmataceae bacterium]